MRGVLPIALAARESGLRGLVLPPENAAEAALVREVEVYPARTLAEVVAFLNGEQALERAPAAEQEDAGRGRETARSRRCAARSSPAGRWRSRPPAGTTCSSSARPGRARRC